MIVPSPLFKNPKSVREMSEKPRESILYSNKIIKKKIILHNNIPRPNTNTNNRALKVYILNNFSKHRILFLRYVL